MIPSPLGPVLPDPAGPRERATTLRMLGVVLLVLGLLGALTWTARFSTLGHVRVPLASGDRIIELDRPGTYVVFEEFAGASSPQRPSPIAVVVTGEGGRPVTVEQLQDTGLADAPLAYETWWHEGRGLARFTIEEPGRYRVELRLLRDAIDDPAYRPLALADLAIAEESATGWLGSWFGLIVLAGLPVAVGSVLLLVARLRRRERFAEGPEASDGSPGDAFALR